MCRVILKLITLTAPLHVVFVCTGPLHWKIFVRPKRQKERRANTSVLVSARSVFGSEEIEVAIITDSSACGGTKAIIVSAVSDGNSVTIRLCGAKSSVDVLSAEAVDGEHDATASFGGTKGVERPCDSISSAEIAK